MTYTTIDSEYPVPALVRKMGELGLLDERLDINSVYCHKEIIPLLEDIDFYAGELTGEKYDALKYICQKDNLSSVNQDFINRHTYINLLLTKVILVGCNEYSVGHQELEFALELSHDHCRLLYYKLVGDKYNYDHTYNSFFGRFVSQINKNTGDEGDLINKYAFFIWSIASLGFYSEDKSGYDEVLINAYRGRRCALQMESLVLPEKIISADAFEVFTTQTATCLKVLESDLELANMLYAKLLKRLRIIFTTPPEKI